MAERTPERLTRLLALVAYLAEHPEGVPVAQAAAHFEVAESQLLADINLLWVSGTPGYLPHDLIDFHADALDHGVIRLLEARGMDRPLRLAPGEAVALIVALRRLRESAGEAAPGALDSALAKLIGAAGESATAAEAVTVVARDSDPALQGREQSVREALRLKHRVWLRYVSAGDAVTERTVDPVMLHDDGGVPVLRGWCHRARGARSFRLDRILALEILDEEAAAHPDLTPSEQGSGPGESPDALRATIHLASAARWVAEKVPAEKVTDGPEGSFFLTVRIGDRAWATNLLLSLGEHVLGVTPAEVGRDVASRARAALAEYEQLGHPFDTSAP